MPGCAFESFTRRGGGREAPADRERERQIFVHHRLIMGGWREGRSSEACITSPHACWESEETGAEHGVGVTMCNGTQAPAARGRRRYLPVRCNMTDITVN